MAIDDSGEKRRLLLEKVENKLEAFSEEEMAEKNKVVESRLFEFANFVESKTVLLYVNREGELITNDIIKKTLESKKVVVLPVFDPQSQKTTLYKIDDLEKDMTVGADGIPQPNPSRCKVMTEDQIEIAVIPGLVFDEKGGRISLSKGPYDKLITSLPATTRKIAIAYEEQISSQIPMESKSKYIDILITDTRTIYKI